jgi:hypothetical protein
MSRGPQVLDMEYREPDQLEPKNKTLRCFAQGSLKETKGPVEKINQDLFEGWGISSRASSLHPWVPNGMTLPASSYHAKVVALGCMAKRKEVSSRASFLIFVKVLVGNIVTSSHQARAMSLN